VGRRVSVAARKPGHLDNVSRNDVRVIYNDRNDVRVIYNDRDVRVIYNDLSLTSESLMTQL
jgi:hypothetical protein